MVDGEYIRASLGYDGFAFLEGSFRSDRSSTLKANNRFDYFSVSGSLVFSQLVDAPWLSFGKVANYAVGSATDPTMYLIHLILELHLTELESHPSALKLTRSFT
jgi:hypothetical protein